MTLIVGVRCKNGVVMGSDSAATFVDGGGQYTIRNEESRKIHIIEKKMIFALTGSTAMTGRIQAVLAEIWKREVHRERVKLPNQPHIDELAPADAAEWIRKVLWDKVYMVECQAAAVAQNAGWRTTANEAYSAFMLAVPFKGEKCSLFAFNAVGLPDEVSETLFCNNLGSGQPIADPFMGFLRRVLWNDRPPDVQQAILGVAWCLKHAIALHPGGVGGRAQLAVLEFNRGTGWIARQIPEADLAEHEENIRAIENVMRKWQAGELGTQAEPPPEAPSATPPAA